MRNWIIAIAATALAGCGSGGSDFSVTVAGDGPTIKRQLAAMDTRGFGSGFGSSVRTETGDDHLRFIIPTAQGYDDAEIMMAFAPNGDATNIEVTVEVPLVEMGDDMALSEEKVEKELKRLMREWAKNYRESGPNASTTELGFTIGAVSVLAQQIEPGEDSVFASPPQNGGWGSDTGYDDEESGGWGSDATKAAGKSSSYSGGSSDAGWGAGN